MKNARRILDQAKGPECLGRSLKRLAIEVFPGMGEHAGRAHAWITLWVDSRPRVSREVLVQELRELCSTDSAVVQWRVKSEGLTNCEVLWGDPPQGEWITQEQGLSLITRFTQVKHAGVFLDHAPLRIWLRTHMRGLSVLNTFAYTGTLSVAAQVAGASRVCTVDLSKATIAWAKRNAELNAGLQDATPLDQMDFWVADVLEWLPRTAKRIAAGKQPAFDAVILDPPSFSRSKSGTFSTQKDLITLHVQALSVLARGGYLITSVNSEFLSQIEFEKAVLKAGHTAGRALKKVGPLQAPKPFPETQIKGAIFIVN